MISILSGIAVIFTFSALLGYINHRWVKLPTTIGVMLLSIVISVGLKIFDAFRPEVVAPLRDALLGFDFSSFVLNFILCFLLFAGSLHLKISDLRESRGAIFSYATIGTLVSTFLVAAGLKALSSVTGIDIPWITCFLFGALISPTDPIAVLGILRKYNLPRRIETEIVGESLFNDGIGVVIFTFIFSIAQEGNVSGGELFHLFVTEVGGGLLLGFAFGYVGYRLMKSIDHYQTEVLITLAVVTGGYSLASIIHASGPLAMVVAGIIIGNKGKDEAMSDTTSQYVDRFWELIDEICNTLLFVLMGLQVFLLSFHPYYILPGLICIILVLAARFLSLLPLFFFFNRREDKKFLQLGVLTWGGLRGGISVSLSLILAKNSPYGEELLVITFMIVLFSILVQGLTITRLLRPFNNK